ncbi:Cys6 transcription factor domain-containing protein, partial [Aspergillus homomorphus CBS 101889]
WTCSPCAATFHRIDHYKRHISSRAADKPYRCSFCTSSYKRRDVLRRHWKSCSARLRSGYTIPEARAGGKERHACDACARLKKSCDGGVPCLECKARGRGCTYRRVGRASDDGVEREEGGDSQLGLRAGEDLEAGPWSLGPQNFYSLQAAKVSAYGGFNL